MIFFYSLFLFLTLSIYPVQISQINNNMSLNNHIVINKLNNHPLSKSKQMIINSVTKYADSNPKNLQEAESHLQIFAKSCDKVFDVLSEKKCSNFIDQLITKIFKTTLKISDDFFLKLNKTYALLQAHTLDQYAIEKKNISPDLITAQQIKDSDFWQNYLKFQISSFYDNELSLLSQIHTQQIQVFDYLPNFEVSYYSKEYEQLRNGIEFVRMSMILLDLVRGRMIDDCNDWKTIKDQKKLYNEIVKFKTTDFYKIQIMLDGLSSESNIDIKYPLLSSTGKIMHDFSHILNYEPLKNLWSISEKYQSFFVIDKKTNKPQITSLGSKIFEIKEFIDSKTSKKETQLLHTQLFKKLFIIKPDDSVTPTTLYIDILLIQQIRALMTQLSYLFDDKNLVSTMDLIEKIELEISSLPSIIYYKSSDFLYLDDINEMKKTVGNIDTSGVVVQFKIGNWFKKIGQGIVHWIMKDIVKPIENTFIHLGNSIKYGFEGLGYEIIGNKKMSVKCIKKSVENLTSVGNDLQDLVKGIAQGVKGIIHTVTSIIGFALNFIAPQLGNDLAGIVNSLCDTFIDFVSNTVNFVISVSVSIVKLSLEAINFVVDAVLQGVSGGKLGGDFGAISMIFLKDIASSLLSAVNLFVATIKDCFKDIMNVVTYVAGAIIDLIELIGGAFYALGEAIATGSASKAKAAYMTVVNKIEDHRRFISAIVSNSIMIAIAVIGIVLSCGAMSGAGGLAMAGAIANISFAASMTAMQLATAPLQIMSAWQKDIQSMSQKQEEEMFVGIFGKYVDQNIKFNSITQDLQNDILITQLSGQKDCQERGLVAYQDFMNKMFNDTVSASGFTLRSFIAQSLSKNEKTELRLADSGSIYGIQTDRFSLNPSQEFLIYNQFQNSFSQELATNPIILRQSDNILKDDSLYSYWFLQKDLANINGTQNSTQEIEVKWKLIYDTGSEFHIGIYQTEKCLDAESLVQLEKDFTNMHDSSSIDQELWNRADNVGRQLVDYDYKAKMSVLHRDSISKNPEFKIYEHSDKKWLKSVQVPFQFKPGTWYRIKTISTISDEHNVKLQSKIWQDDLPEPSDWSTEVFASKAIPFSIDKNGIIPFSGSFGFITSGAAVEYQIIKPETSVIISKERLDKNAFIESADGKAKYFANENSPTYEKDRELDFHQTSIPFAFSNITLSIVYSGDLFVYKGKSLSLDFTNQDDYFIMTNLSIYGSISNPKGMKLLKTDKKSSINSIISLSTGVVYNMQDANKNNINFGSIELGKISLIQSDMTLSYVFDEISSKLDKTTLDLISKLKGNYLEFKKKKELKDQLISSLEDAKSQLKQLSGSIKDFEKLKLKDDSYLKILTTSKTAKDSLSKIISEIEATNSKTSKLTTDDLNKISDKLTKIESDVAASEKSMKDLKQKHQNQIASNLSYHLAGGSSQVAWNDQNSSSDDLGSF